MNSIICARRISECVKRKLIGRFGGRRSKIWVSILLELKKKFKEGDEELVKVAELKRIGQGERIMEEFV